MSKESAAGDRPARGEGVGAPGRGAELKPQVTTQTSETTESKNKEEYKNSGGCLQLLILAVVACGAVIGAVLMFGDFAK